MLLNFILFINLPTICKRGALAITVLPSFAYFVNRFAWWWPYWPKHVANFCQTRIVFVIKVVNWVRIAFFPMLAAKSYMLYLLLYSLSLCMRNITNYEVSCYVILSLLLLLLLWWIQYSPHRRCVGLIIYLQFFSGARGFTSTKKMKLHARLKYEDFWKPAGALKTLKKYTFICIFCSAEALTELFVKGLSVVRSNQVSLALIKNTRIIYYTPRSRLSSRNILIVLTKSTLAAAST